MTLNNLKSVRLINKEPSLDPITNLDQDKVVNGKKMGPNENHTLIPSLLICNVYEGGLNLDPITKNSK